LFMSKITRRNAITLTGSLLLVAVVRAELPANENPFRSKNWAQSADDPAVGREADFDSLSGRLKAFFGTATGRYLADQVVDLETALPGFDTRERPIYEQFTAIFRGAPELDAVLSNGVRMVVRYRSTYKAAVFLDSFGSVVAAALTFEYCPPGGIDQQVVGRSVHSECLWPFSAVLFRKSKQPDAVIVAALQAYVTSLPMDLERTEAAYMSPDGKIRVKVFGRQIG
jgi:hypothetical protein